DEAGATTDLESAVQNDPKYGLSHYWLAQRRMAQKKWADAAKELEAYLKIEPNGPKAKTAQEALAVAKKRGKEKGRERSQVAGVRRALWLLVLCDCSNGSCPTPGGPASGDAGRQCSTVQTTSQASCFPPPDASAPDGAGDYGATLDGVDGDEDDCK